MRGTDPKQGRTFTYVSSEARVPTNYPPSPIRTIVSDALEQMDRKFRKLYSQPGRPSIAPERHIRALLLLVLNSIRSERMPVEQAEYNLLFRWFVGPSVNAPAWDHSKSNRNLHREFRADIPRDQLDAIADHPRIAGLLSDEHFSVDGTMSEAWASHKSFQPKDGSVGPPATSACIEERDFHEGQRASDTHASTTDPEANLYKASRGTPAKLAYLANAARKTRYDLIVAAEATQTNETAERSAAAQMPKDLPTAHRAILASDKSYDTPHLASDARKLNVTPHVAPNIERNSGSANTARTTRNASHTLSIKARKLIEDSFGSANDIGRFRRPKPHGRRKIEAAALLTLTGHNPPRMRSLLAPGFTQDGTHHARY